MLNPKSTKVIRSCEVCKKTYLIKASAAARGRGRFCSRTCLGNGHTVKPLAERFWAKVVKTNGCWFWSGNHRNGRPQFRFPRQTKNSSTNASRVAWELTNGAIPNGLLVCHNCPGGDNPACVNPAHMFLGTQRDNREDASRKGQLCCGERHPNTKFSDQVVRLIRQRYAAGDVTQKQLAIEYGVTGTAIHRIISRENWKHVT